MRRRIAPSPPRLPDYSLAITCPFGTALTRELVFALSEKRYRNRILPILYKPCDLRPLSWTLGGFQMIPFDRDFDTGAAALLKSWGMGYQGAT
jgi:hypothetical protein